MKHHFCNISWHFVIKDTEDEGILALLLTKLIEAEVLPGARLATVLPPQESNGIADSRYQARAGLSGTRSEVVKINNYREKKKKPKQSN